MMIMAMMSKLLSVVLIASVAVGRWWSGIMGNW